jgi:hypothetical protein
MKVAEMMLQVARQVGATYEGIATGGSTSTLVDSTLAAPAETYAGGCLWILTGNNAGACLDVTTHATGGTLTHATQAKANAAGDTYAVTGSQGPRWLLLQVCNLAMSERPVMMTDESLVTVIDQEDYLLPDGVTDIRRVEIAQNNSAPYGYKASYAWLELPRSLNFRQGGLPSDGNKKIRLWYATYPSNLAPTADIPAPMDLAFMKWTAVAHYWRRQMESTYKDNPVAMDLMNEARSNAAQVRKMPLMPRDPYQSGW